LLLDSKTGDTVKQGNFKRNFWCLQFDLPLSTADDSEGRKIVNALEAAKIRGSYKRKANLVQDRAILTGGNEAKRLKLSSNGDDIGKNVISTRSGMTLSDLDEIDKMRIQSLRDCEGLLWHLRFNHASKRYLEMAAKIIPEMRCKIWK